MYKLWVWVFLAAASGILLAKYSDAMFLLPAMFPFIAVFIYRRELAKIIITACCVMVFAFCYYELAVPPWPVSLTDRAGVLISGQIVDFPEHKAGRTILIIAAEADDPCLRKFRVSLDFDGTFARGQQVRFKAALEPVPGPRNPGAFDYAAYMAGEGIYYLGRIDHPGDIVVWQEPGPYDRFINSYRGLALDCIRAALPEEQAATLIGMLLNDVTLITPEDYQLYQNTGIIHLFSVSGLHMGFLILLTAWLAGLLQLRARNRFLGTMLVLTVYGSMAGWPVAVERSALMAGLCLLAHYTGREHQAINGLCLSAVLILALDPQALFNLSFQLTFLATWGLLALYPAVRERIPLEQYRPLTDRPGPHQPGLEKPGLEKPGLEKLRLLQRHLLEALLLPICAELSIVPLVAYNFNLIVPWSLFTNILTIYSSGLAVTLGFIALLAAPASQELAALCLYPAGLMVELINRSAALVAGLPGSHIWVRSPSPGILAVYYAGITILYGSLYRGLRRRWLLPGVALMALMLTLTVVPPDDDSAGQLKIVFVDVGQGDCIYIRTPQGRNLLVDGGGSEFHDVGRLTVSPFLKQEGVRELVLVLNSHPDTDHVAGLEAVFADFQVERLGVPDGQENHPAYARLLTTGSLNAGIQNAGFLNIAGLVPVAGQSPTGTSLMILHAGQRITVEEGLELRVLAPTAGADSSDQNASSLVIELSYGSFRMLLTGDINAEVMENLSAQHWLRPCAVVKVPHHGSRNSLSPAFYMALRPSYAVIQAGPNNSFGHPSQPHLQLLAEQGISVLRTDQDGAITLYTDGSRMRIERFLDHD